jgi:hypothetical protein
MLPHRTDRPNTALWYTREIAWPGDKVLEVSADDGAQVFVDGVQLAANRRWFALGTAARTDTARSVVIRVLNNAMAGGLRRVALVDAVAVPRPSGDGPQAWSGFSRADTAAFRQRMPSPTAACDFTLWADSQAGWTTFARLVALMAERPHHFSAGIGDLVNDGSDQDAWAAFVRTLTPLAAPTPVVPIVGNHDYDGYYDRLRPDLYLSLFGDASSPAPTALAWSCGPARFVAVDMNTEFPIGLSTGSAQHRWLEREVRSADWTSARWRVLLVHQPPWSRSWAGYDGDQPVRRIVEDLTRDHRLDLVVSGHSHAYEHLVRRLAGRDVHVLITGGAGGGLEEPLPASVDVSPDRIILRHHFLRARATREALIVEAVGLDGLAFDQVVLSR